MSTTVKVKKTKLVAYKQKKQKYIKDWKEHKDGESLKKQLLAATKAFVDAGEKLKEIVGTDSVVHNTFICMKDIKKIENGQDKDSPAVKATVESCKRLTELTNLTGKLIHVYGIDFMLIQNTKREIFRAQSTN